MKNPLILLVCLLCTSIGLVNANTINISERGAKGDGITDNTEIIQKAINDCAAKGGGTVYIPTGRYLIRPIEMRSFVNVNIAAGGVLLGSTTLSDYDGKHCLISARGLTNVSITGSGTIDGQGGHNNFLFGDGGGPLKVKRPVIISFYDCKNVEVSGINLRNSATWVQYYNKCENVVLRGLNIYSHSNFNNDGIDIDSRNVVISDCIIDVDDDAICLKSDSKRFCENVTIANCVLATNCNAIKLGTSSYGGFRNINVSNCVVHNTTEDNHHKWKENLKHLMTDYTVLAGVAIEMVDGGILEGVNVSNIVMRNIQTPIFIKLGDRKRTHRGLHGVLKDVNISNIIAYPQSMMASSITGTQEAYVENVQISNVQIIHPGGGTEEMFERVIPENEKKYPENRMFGHTLPAIGFFVRHVKDIRFNNIRINCLSPDARTLFYLDDVKEISIERSKKESMPNKAFIHIKDNCEQVLIDGKLTK